MNTTGAQVAKFGLKIVQSAGQAAGKVAVFIPGVGKPVGKALEGVSKLAGFASDHINVQLPGKLQTGMNVMNTADQIMDYIPKRREFSGQEDFQQRDIDEAHYFEERDDVALENREESYFDAEAWAEEREIYHWHWHWQGLGDS